jgi:large subunit ribosomal protein L29
MKATDIRNLSLEEMKNKASSLEQEIFNLRFQHETGQLENSGKLKQARRDIARMKTIVRQTEAQ